MDKKTEQMNAWSGNFGKEYTDRNALTYEQMEEMYQDNFGISRIEMNKRFLSELDKEIKILEVGSNIGNQLLCLQKMGFKNLYGIELQNYAVEIAKQTSRGINIIQGSGFDVPFKDGYFDLVFTSGVLIHISPNDVKGIMSEVHRCSKKYVWGFEYYADQYTEVQYRGHEGLMWKTNFSKLYLDTFADLKMLKEEKFKYRQNDNEDVMFLLEKE